MVGQLQVRAVFLVPKVLDFFGPKIRVADPDLFAGSGSGSFLPDPDP